MTHSNQKPKLFEYSDYKAYVSDWIASRANGGRGEKAKIAERARCHPAYISQVLTGPSHFSLEQAESLNELLEHGEDASVFFLLLVELGRAGTKALRKHFERQIQKILNQRLQLKNRFTDKKSLTIEHQATYYSHWAYCGVHMAVLNPATQTPGAIAKYFDLSLAKTVEILDFLTSVGLVKNELGLFTPGDMRIHLDHDSPMISKHHTNWRMQAIKALDQKSPQELHYSGVISLSYEDLPRVREELVKALEKIRALVKDSKDETVYCYALDLFGLGRS